MISFFFCCSYFTRLHITDTRGQGFNPDLQFTQSCQAYSILQQQRKPENPHISEGQT